MAANYTLKETTNHGNPAWRADIPAGVTGKRVRIFRATKAEAERAANDYITEHQAHGEEMASLTTQERAFILRLRERGLTVGDVEKLTKDTSSVVMIRAALGDYLKTQTGNSYNHQKSLKSTLKKFSDAHGERSLASIKPADIATYLLGHKSGARAIYRRLRAFFRWALMMGLIEASPIDKVPRPGQDSTERKIFTPDQMRALLNAAKGDPVMLRFLVLGGFYGLRTAEIQRLQCEGIDEVFEVHVRKMKTQKNGIRERYVPAENNAGEWMRLLKLPKTGNVIDVNDANFRIHRVKLLSRVNKDAPDCVPEWPYNVLRRSFGSYHLAGFENANLTAMRMGHTNAETTISKYQAVRKKAVALDWFDIVPAVEQSAKNPGKC